MGQIEENNAADNAAVVAAGNGDAQTMLADYTSNREASRDKSIARATIVWNSKIQLAELTDTAVSLGKLEGYRDSLASDIKEAGFACQDSIDRFALKVGAFAGDEAARRAIYARDYFGKVAGIVAALQRMVKDGVDTVEGDNGQIVIVAETLAMLENVGPVAGTEAEAA